MDMHRPPFRLPGDSDEGEPLRAIDWAGLIARLGAERDLRRELSARVGAAAAGASFVASAASALEAATDETDVNPETLALRKATPANGPVSTADKPGPDSEA